MGTDDAVARFAGMSGGYESFYLRACRPGGGLGIWVRYTVHRRPGHRPTGSLWFTLFDADAAGPTAAKVTVPDPAAGDGDWIRIAGAHLRDGVAVGRITAGGTGGQRGAGRPGGQITAGGQRGAGQPVDRRAQLGTEVSWDLRFSGEPALRHLPRGWMYRAPLPRTKPISLHPAARFDGTVTVDGRVVELDGWPGMVGHNWGSQHAQRWIWLHGMALDRGGDGDRDGDGTWLDVVLGRIVVAGRTTPWIASGAVSVDGERLALGGPHRTRTTVVDEAPDRLDFTLPGRGVLVSGQVHAPRERFVGWVYADPDGSEHHTVNCSVADLTLTVARGGRPPLTLSAAGTAAYELGMREHDHGVPIQPFPDG